MLKRVRELRALLSDDELVRADRFRFQSDRDDFLAAHVLVRLCAAEATGLDASEIKVVQVCPHCGGPHGPPRLEGLTIGVSFSHTRGYVAAAVGRSPVGIDIERMDRDGDRRVTCAPSPLVFAPAEARFIEASRDPHRAFYSLWVRKEALVKTGSVTFEALPAVDLVGGDTTIVRTWNDLRLIGWDGFGVLVGACATRDAARFVEIQPDRAGATDRERQTDKLARVELRTELD